MICSGKYSTDLQASAGGRGEQVAEDRGTDGQGGGR